ncbi:EARP-interacting protein homolog [Hydra vulgaris]|uniref:EARP-interacting protein homolog n=1 Tax=Hydra vulgaris TaxID=6087 RepID=UPI001F5FCE64|nr:EARP-interacting protein homolog [Hydra vulgaris]
MNDDGAVIYGVEFQARSLCPQHGDTDAVRFLVGTQSLKRKNQVHLIEFDEETNLINKNIVTHEAGEIWDINSNPLNKNVISTCYNVSLDNKIQTKASLWQIPPLDDMGPVHSNSMLETSQYYSLQHICDLDAGHGHVRKVLWNLAGDCNKLVTISEHHIDIWDNNTVQLTNSISLEGKVQLQYSNGRFSPHHSGSQIAAAIDTTVKGYDLRSMSVAFTIEDAHSQTVRDMDFNPNKQYYLVSCSDDCKVKFWDTRNTHSPLMIRTDHSHWIWSVRYNNFHDQLVLTSSSDSRVILSNIASLSSEPYGHIDDEDNSESKEPDSDRIINIYDEHEDSVYAVEWSVADPWTFASLSYDGRLVINKVPRVEKYKILL